MYRVSVPLMLNQRFEKDFDLLMDQCRQAGVQRVFLCPCMSISPEEQKQEHLRLLRTYLPRVEEAGFEAAVWTNSLGHGGAPQPEGVTNDTTHPGVRLMADIDGRYLGYSYCPLNETFTGLFCQWVQDLARAGARTIMLDDDYRLSFRAGQHFCACPAHMKKLEEELGEPVTRAFIKGKLAEKAPNRYRDAWLKVQGDSLLGLAKKLRAALDEVDPTVRLGHCAVLSTWDIDGVDSMELSRAFAGNNPPFLRYIGAPYWAALHAFGYMRLAYVCVYERLQQGWCRKSGIETFCEGDSYPRPRETVPAAYLEGFDTAMRVAGTNDGILKYMFDYTSSPRFETGYLDAHRRHMPLYEALHRHFDGKTAVGVSVFQPMHTLASSQEPGEDWEERCIPAALRFACDCGLPVRYDTGDEPTLLFGDAAAFAGEEQLAHGAILDLSAAEILTRRGWDVGLAAAGVPFAATGEYFPAEDEDGEISGTGWYETTPAPGAQVLSWLVGPAGRAPAAYFYRNAAGRRFLVYAFKAQEAYERTAPQHGVFRSRNRTLQVQAALPRLCGKQPAVVCSPAPNLYVQAKTDGRSLSVALWNFCEDELYGQTVTLPGGKAIHWAVGSGAFSGGVVRVEPIPPFGMAAFTVEL